MVGGTVLTELETRLANGERYLATNPDDDNGKALYYRLLTEYVALCEQAEREQDIKAVTLELPPGCQYQRQGCESAHSRVRVLFQGQPSAGNELTRDELRVHLADRREALEMAKRKE